MRGAIWHCSLSSSILSLEMAPLLDYSWSASEQDKRDRGRIRTFSFNVGDMGARYLALQLILFIYV